MSSTDKASWTVQAAMQMNRVVTPCAFMQVINVLSDQSQAGKPFTQFGDGEMGRVAMKVRITSLGGMLSVGCRMALSSSGVSIRIDMDVGLTLVVMPRCGMALPVTITASSMNLARHIARIEPTSGVCHEPVSLAGSSGYLRIDWFG